MTEITTDVGVELVVTPFSITMTHVEKHEQLVVFPGPVSLHGEQDIGLVVHTTGYTHTSVMQPYKRSLEELAYDAAQTRWAVNIPTLQRDMRPQDA